MTGLVHAQLLGLGTLRSTYAVSIGLVALVAERHRPQADLGHLQPGPAHAAVLHDVPLSTLTSPAKEDSNAPGVNDPDDFSAGELVASIQPG